MVSYVFDIETDGLLVEATKIHSLVMRDEDTGEVHSFTDSSEFGTFDYSSLAHGLEMLAKADRLVGHNIAAFDIPAIQKIVPGWKPKPGASIVDTLIISQLLFPDLRDLDIRAGRIPGQFFGRHSLEAWGHRIGHAKGSVTSGAIRKDGEKTKTKKSKEDFAVWTKEMQDYCEQDTLVQLHLWKYLGALPPGWKRPVPTVAYRLEVALAPILAEMHLNGVPLNVRALQRLYVDLSSRAAEISEGLVARIGKVWVKRGPIITPKQHDKPHLIKAQEAKGVTPGAPYQPIKQEDFNPSSLDQLARVLQARYGWKPTEFTDKGKVRLDGDTIKGVPVPAEFKAQLEEFVLLSDRLGQLGNGDGSLLKLERKGRVHTEYRTFGTDTGRASHVRPNLNIPKVGSPFGEEFRSAFEAPPGWLYVGSDLKGLELRMLGAEMAQFDGGAYVLSALKHDPHTDTKNLVGLSTRDEAKTFI
jgi:DNA polymerase I